MEKRRGEKESGTGWDKLEGAINQREETNIVKVTKVFTRLISPPTILNPDAYKSITHLRNYCA